jgi:hypothetical protein
MFTILDQLVDRLEIKSPLPSDVRETLRRCAHDRAKAR